MTKTTAIIIRNGEGRDLRVNIEVDAGKFSALQSLKTRHTDTIKLYALTGRQEQGETLIQKLVEKFGGLVHEEVIKILPLLKGTGFRVTSDSNLLVFDLGHERRRKWVKIEPYMIETK